MVAPLIVAGALGTAALGSAIYSSTKKNAQLEPAYAQQTYYGGDPDEQKRIRGTLEAQDQQALGFANQQMYQGQQARELQTDSYGRFRQMADGKGPSVARQMAKEGADNAARAAQQQAASTRGGGGNQLAAQRMAMQTGAELASKGNQQAATLGQQEQLAAMGQMGDMASTMRAGDAQARAMSEARAADRSGTLNSVNTSVLQADTQRSLANAQAQQEANAFNAAQKQKDKDKWWQMAQTFAGAGGAAAGSYAGKG
jgi:hypothetical protein